jgi:hypothetical protein
MNNNNKKENKRIMVEVHWVRLVSHMTRGKVLDAWL